MSGGPSKKSRWRTLGEFIGVATVVVSLLLVVLELRQTQSAITAAAHSDRTLRNLEINRFATEQRSDEIREKQTRGENLSTSEQQVLNVLFQMRLRHFEDLHYQYSIGTISEETWAANLQGLGLTVSSVEYAENWRLIRRFFRPSFAALVEEVAQREGI